ncbi:hypothetical protein ID866_9020, partial [Astraeus odoratus]
YTSHGIYNSIPRRRHSTPLGLLVRVQPLNKTSGSNSFGHGENSSAEGLPGQQIRGQRVVQGPHAQATYVLERSRESIRCSVTRNPQRNENQGGVSRRTYGIKAKG